MKKRRILDSEVRFLKKGAFPGGVKLWGARWDLREGLTPACMFKNSCIKLLPQHPHPIATVYNAGYLGRLLTRVSTVVHIFRS